MINIPLVAASEKGNSLDRAHKFFMCSELKESDAQKFFLKSFRKNLLEGVRKLIVSRNPLERDTKEGNSPVD